ncbi:helix-turn-helix transcriptional regulator [Diaphorobacter ruginosibacter]|uniref:Helix-turn-helix transcriptional regulator n=1 Tax=Diaphorobacter ruginosibacter TaxID=1715720 RepID=A0A7G9RP09_9BURK|nr:helix-turn-helix transcriptional regulator [Diaphorobacter ruginosibacter]QNN57334.1 helix-turn-helix transcriptional regulator [Diaphorobacter ruginosibacter]
MDEFTVRTTEQLPQLLKAFRKNAKLTQADVALRLGVTQQTVSAMERNAETVSAERLMKLMGILGVDLVLRARTSQAAPLAQPGHMVNESRPRW